MVAQPFAELAVGEDQAGPSLPRDLRGHGVECTDVFDRGSFRSIYIRDPDGHIVEIALITPLILIALYIPVDFGISFFVANLTQTAAREGARVGSGRERTAVPEQWTLGWPAAYWVVAAVAVAWLIGCAVVAGSGRARGRQRMQRERKPINE